MPRSDLPVLPLSPAQVPSVAALLARALDDDPAYRFLFPAPASRESGLRDLFARNLRTHLPYACTYVLEREGHVAATVTVRPPGGVPVSLLTMVRRGLLPFALANGAGAVRRLLRLKEIYDRIEADLGAGKPYWHVHMMAVAPSLQGQGLGSRLLEAVLARTSDRNPPPRDPTVLTTHTERNTVFYRRMGFEVVETRELVPPQVHERYTVWCMRRA